MPQNVSLTAEDRQEHAENIDPLTETTDTMNKEPQLSRSSSRSLPREEPAPPRERMTGRPPMIHSLQRMTGRPPNVGRMPAEDLGRPCGRSQGSRDRFGRLQDRFGGRVARSGDHRDRNADRQNRREDCQNQSREHRDRQGHSRSRSRRPEADRDRREDRADHHRRRNDRSEPQSDHREAHQDHTRHPRDRDRGREGHQEPSHIGRSRSRSAMDRDQDHRRNSGQAAGPQESVEPVVDSWPPPPKRRRAPLLGDRPPLAGMPAQQPPAPMPPQEPRPQGAPFRSRVPCWRGPAPPMPPDELDSFAADLATSNADGGIQDSSTRTMQRDPSLGRTTRRIPSGASVPALCVPNDVEAVASMPAVPEEPSNDAGRLSLIDELLAEMEKEPEIAAINRQPLRSVQPSGGDPTDADSVAPVHRPANTVPMRLRFEYFNHDIRPSEKEQETVLSSTTAVQPAEAESRPVLSDPPTSNCGRQGGEDSDRRPTDNENAVLRMQLQELQDRCLAMELESQQAQEKHEQVVADQRAEISLVKQMLSNAQTEVGRLIDETRRLQDAAVVHIDDTGATGEQSREVAQLRRDVEEQKRQAEEAKKDAEQHERRAEELQNDVQEQKHQAEELRKQAEELRKQAEEQNRRAEDLLKDAEEQKVVAKLAQKEAARAAGELRQSNADRATLRQEMDRLAQNLEQMRKENAEQANIIGAQETVSKLAKQRKDDAERQLNSMRLMLKEIARRLRDKRCFHCTDTAQMAERLEHLQWDHDMADNAASELTASILKKDQQIAQLEGALEILREQFRTAEMTTEDHQPSTSGALPTETTVEQGVGPQQQTTGPHRKTAGPQHPTAGPQQQTSGPQLQTTGPQQLTSAPQQHTTGPQQHMSGPQQQTSGPQLQTTGPQQQTSGPQQLTSGPQQLTTGPQPQTTGPQQQTTGPQPQTTGPQQQTSGPQQLTSGPQQQTTGPQPQTTGPQQQTTGPQPQTDGPQQQATTTAQTPGRNAVPEPSDHTPSTPTTTRPEPPVSSGPSQKKFAVGGENTVRPSEAVPVGPRQSDGADESVLARKSARRGECAQPSVKQEVVSQATTDNVPANQTGTSSSTNVSPTGNRRSTDSGIGLDATPPSRPLAGPKPRTAEPQQQTSGSHQRPTGPLQNSGLHHQTFGPNPRTAGPHQLTTGPNPQTAGPHQLTPGPQQHMFGPQQHASGPQHQSIGPHQQTAGHLQLPSGPHQHMSGPQQPSTGPSHQVPSRPHQAVVRPHGPPGGSHLRAILERPPGPQAASTRHQGPPPQWTTPAHHAVPGGPQCQTPRCVAPPLGRLNGWLPPGLTAIWPTPLICRIQDTNNYVEVAANAATGAPVFGPPNPQLLVHAVSMYHAAQQAAQVPVQQPERGPQQPTLQQQQQPRSSTRSAAPRRRTLADIPALAPCVASAQRQPPTMPQPGPSDPSRQHAVQNAQPPILDAHVDPQQFAQAMNDATSAAPTVPSTSHGAPSTEPSSSIWPPASSYPTFLEQFQERGMAEAARGPLEPPGGTGDGGPAQSPQLPGRR